MNNGYMGVLFLGEGLIYRNESNCIFILLENNKLFAKIDVDDI